MNRTYVLKETLPSIIVSANKSPPVEIVILDYSSTDDLQTYLSEVSKTLLTSGNTFSFPYITGYKYFQIGHARNAAAKASCGEYLVNFDTDTILSDDYISYIRKIIEGNHPHWMCQQGTRQHVVIRRSTFIECGGYDERFTAYGKEDKDLIGRLYRRNEKCMLYSKRHTEGIRTGNTEKLKNLDLESYSGRGIWAKRAMGRDMKVIYFENIDSQTLTANDGLEWGKFDGYREQ